MAKTKQEPLEERARDLLRLKITGRGRTPNPFTEDFTKELQFLIDKGYVVQRGGTPKSLRYDVTFEGRKYAWEK